MRCLHVLLLVVFCWQRIPAHGLNFPTARDIRWSSINCKTILDWSPKPTNYSYTVMIRGQNFQDWKKKCIYTTDTTCDVTDLLKEPRSNYEVRIVSEIKSTEIVTEEFPYAEGPSFNPYEQTTIGKPAIQNYTFNKDGSRLTVVVSDTPTPMKFANNTPMTLRDIFAGDFIYTLFYRRAYSTGKKQQTSNTNEITISTDKGESYCFFVQASVPSRKQNRVSQNSDEVCTQSDGAEFDVTILVAVGAAVALIVLIVVLSVVLYKCRNGKNKEKTKEATPLNEA